MYDFAKLCDTELKTAYGENTHDIYCVNDLIKQLEERLDEIAPDGYEIEWDDKAQGVGGFIDFNCPEGIWNELDYLIENHGTEGLYIHITAWSGDETHTLADLAFDKTLRGVPYIEYEPYCNDYSLFLYNEE